MYRKALIFTLICHFCMINALSKKKEDIITSLNEVKRLEIFGDAVVLLSKNYTSTNDSIDDFERYVKSHYIEIKLPEIIHDVVDIELNDLVSLEDHTEGRAKLRKILLPILLALKIKSAIAIPVFMSLIAIIAIKGLKSGILALLISKLIALKALLRDKHHHHDFYDHHDHYDHHSKPQHDSTHLSHHEYWNRDSDSDKPFIIYFPAAEKLKTRASNRDEVVTDAQSNSDYWGNWDNSQTQGENFHWGSFN